MTADLKEFKKKNLDPLKLLIYQGSNGCVYCTEVTTQGLQTPPHTPTDVLVHLPSSHCGFSAHTGPNVFFFFVRKAGLYCTWVDSEHAVLKVHLYVNAILLLLCVAMSRVARFEWWHHSRGKDTAPLFVPILTHSVCSHRLFFFCFFWKRKKKKKLNSNAIPVVALHKSRLYGNLCTN